MPLIKKNWIGEKKRFAKGYYGEYTLITNKYGEVKIQYNYHLKSFTIEVRGITFNIEHYWENREIDELLDLVFEEINLKKKKRAANLYLQKGK